MLSALLRGGEIAWTIARAGLDQAWMSALTAIAELSGAGSADADVPVLRRRTFIADADLKLEVASALRKDEALRSSIIVVESVYDGLVVLAGRVPTLATHRRAFEVAAGIPGVRRVMSTIDATPSLAADGSRNGGALPARAAAPATDEPSGMLVDGLEAQRRGAADEATSDTSAAVTDAIIERVADADASGALRGRVRRRRRSAAGRRRAHDRRAAPPMPAVDEETPDDACHESANAARIS